MFRFARYARAVTIAVCMCAACAAGEENTEKIQDLGSYLEASESYQTAGTLEKLKQVAELVRQDRIGRRDETLRGTTRTLATRYMEEKGGDDPSSRLAALGELKEMTGYGKPLKGLPVEDDWSTPDLVLYLSSHPEYGEATPEGKIKILRDLHGGGIWGPWAKLQAERACIAHLSGVGTDLPAAQKNMERLKALAKLKSSKMLRWSGTYKGLEQAYLTAHLVNNREYQGGATEEKLRILAGMEDADRITPFARADQEVFLVVPMLFADQSFRNATVEEQKERIQQLYEDGMIHTFTRSRVQQVLGLPR